jgi:hypothetical protein
VSTDPLLRPRNLQTAAQFDKATEILKTVMTSTDADVMGEAIEAAASDADLAHAVIFRLVVLARGWAKLGDEETGVELVARALAPPEGLVMIVGGLDE